MTFDYLFQASPKWEQAIDRGIITSSESFIAGCFLVMDFTSALYALPHYSLNSTKMWTNLILFLGLFLLLVMLSGYYVFRLCTETRERLRSGFIDADSRRTLLNVSYMAFRIYLILLFIPVIFFFAIQAVHP